MENGSDDDIGKFKKKANIDQAPALGGRSVMVGSSFWQSRVVEIVVGEKKKVRG